MAKYKQVFTYDSEDTKGSNEFHYIITDDFNLLSDDSPADEIDMFLFADYQAGISNDNGTLERSISKVVTAEYFIETQEEQDCLDLVISNNTDVYIAIIVNPNTPLQKQDFLFIGKFDSKIREEAVNWQRDEYSETIEIKKAYEFTVIEIIDQLFQNIKFKDIIDNIDSTWIDDNVEDKQGWRTMDDVPFWLKAEQGSFDLNTYCCDLVNLNKVTRKITDEATILFNDLLSVSGFTIHFTKPVKLPGKYAPARWRVVGDRLWVANRTKEKANYNFISGKWEDLEMYHNIDDSTDFKELYFNPDEIGTATDDNSIFVDMKYFKDIGNEYEYNKVSADSYRIGADDSYTFHTYIIELAINFNVHYFYDIDLIDKKINIVMYDNVQTLLEEKIYFKDAEEYVKDTVVQSFFDSKNSYISEAFYGLDGSKFGKTNQQNGGCIYGKEQYGVFLPDDTPRPVVKEQELTDNEKKIKLLFCIGPTVARIKDTVSEWVSVLGVPKVYKKDLVIRLSVSGGSQGPAPIKIENGDIIPHNTKVIMDAFILGPGLTTYDLSDKWPFNTRSMHTAMYIKCNQKELYEPTEYYTPIRAMAVKIDGNEYNFDTLEAYLNNNINRYTKLAEENIELSIPYWNAFSTNSDGSNPDIKNLKLGKRITINSVNYIVRNIKIDLVKPSVKIELFVEKYYSDITNPSTPKTTNSLQGVSSPEIVDIENNEDYDRQYIEGTADFLTALNINSSNNLETLTDPEKVISYFGLCLENIADSWGKVIKSPGTYYINDLPYSVGDVLYLRVNGGVTNISTEYLKQKVSSTDCVYKKIGVVIANNTLKLLDEEEIWYV